MQGLQSIVVWALRSYESSLLLDASVCCSDWCTKLDWRKQVGFGPISPVEECAGAACKVIFVLFLVTWMYLWHCLLNIWRRLINILVFVTSIPHTECLQRLLVNPQRSVTQWIQIQLFSLFHWHGFSQSAQTRRTELFILINTFLVSLKTISYVHRQRCLSKFWATYLAKDCLNRIWSLMQSWKFVISESVWVCAISFRWRFAYYSWNAAIRTYNLQFWWWSWAFKSLWMLDGLELSQRR